ncbi:haloacid dehalogenase-like hydrolase [Pseudarthrobacter equi]|uniref:haloacid dehalogenase-like hydrolase n=1 Tax=Pseudarthrobacter equi TaxID=728066 RepID=UPI0021BE7B73|nr:haloacid dehalogenase-like hydrolase [Pseudarthrobacter equi]MCT9625782.1 haloacid dehalogenase-like hydrolase [Pseudarthrobacter equi]
MPPAVYTQNIIALIWDFDKTLTHDYMQKPLFERYDVDSQKFWAEVNGLESFYFEHYKGHVSSDTVYLNHIVSYVRAQKFKNLTNALLRELGAEIELAPGLPDFFQRAREVVHCSPYERHDIKVEHHIVSTGLREMIRGSSLFPHINGDIWACDLLPEAVGPGYLEQLPTTSDVIDQVGYTIDNTTKTRAIFEINKGVNVADNHSLTVNSLVPEDHRRVPIRNMIYIADGPSDIPSFSVVNRGGGKTLGVYAPGERNYENAAVLEEQSRVNSIAEADYSVGSAADRWLLRAIKKMADQIVRDRENALRSYGGAPGHVV